MSLFVDKALRKAQSHMKAGELADAEKFYKQVLSKFPKNKKAIQGYLKLKKVITSKGVSTAVPTREQVDELRSLYTQRQFEVVLAKVKPLVSLFPKAFILYNIQGASYAALHKHDDAIESYKTAIKIKPDYAAAYNNMGIALKDKGEFDAAIDSYKQALKIKPDFAEVFSNMGSALNKKGDLDAAIDICKQAIKIKPDFAKAFTVLGIALNDKGELDAATDSYKQAIKINPEYANAQFNGSLAYLAKEDFRNGWQQYEWRWEDSSCTSVPLSSKKSRWDPEKAGSLLLWSEQGIGDIIMFSSMIFELYQQVEQLVIQIDKRLIPLFSRSFPKDIIYYPNGEKVPESAYDTHIPFGSLPIHFRPNLESFKQTSGPYLKANKIFSSKLREILRNCDNDYIVGLTWRGGSKKNSVPTNKAASLIEIAQVLSKKGVKLVNLQYGDTDEECKKLETDYGIKVHDVSEVDNFNDLDGLAALVEACDHIVSTDNLTVHIAGALGKKTTVLLPFSADWRWGVKRADSYWHSSVSSLRQKNISCWEATLEMLKTEFDFRNVKSASNGADQVIGGQNT